MSLAQYRSTNYPSISLERVKSVGELDKRSLSSPQRLPRTNSEKLVQREPTTIRSHQNSPIKCGKSPKNSESPNSLTGAAVAKSLRLTAQRTINAAAFAAGSVAADSQTLPVKRGLDERLSREPSTPGEEQLMSGRIADGGNVDTRNHKHYGVEPPSPTSSMCFRSLALKAVEERKRKERLRFYSRKALTALKAVSLGIFIFLLLAAATYDTWLHNTPITKVLSVSLGMYVGIMIPIWAILLLYLLRGRFYERILHYLRQRHYEKKKELEIYEGTYPLKLMTNNSLEPQFIGKYNQRKSQSNAFEKNSGLNLARNNLDTSVTPTLISMHQKSSMDLFMGRQHNKVDSGGGRAQRMKSDADLLYYYWASQKHRMKRGELQADAAGDTNFTIPTVMTTGQIIAPSYQHRPPLQNLYLDRMSEPISSVQREDQRRGLDLIGPYESCPHLTFRAHGPRTSQVENNTRHINMQNPKISLWNPRHWDHKLFFIRETFKPTGVTIFHLAMKIYDFPPFQISSLLRNFAWCGLYIWGTTLIQRETPQDLWDMSQVPATFRIIEACFMWMITLDYLVFFLAAEDQLRFIVSFQSIVDLLTMPPSRVIASFVSVESMEQYSLYTGSLRVLRLVRIETTLLNVIPWISQVKLRIISLAVGASVITLMFASIMFTLEASKSNESSFHNVYAFTYFALVTISTVGYGDFAPKKAVSKAIVMSAIVIALTFLPSQIQKLISALQTPPRVIGRIPQEHQDYILVFGPIAPRQLTSICREFYHSLPSCCNNILIVSPDPINTYTAIIRAAFTRGRIRVSAVQSDSCPAKIRPFFRNARAIFIVGDVRLPSDEVDVQLIYRDPEATLLEDDHKTLMRFLGAQQISWPNRPICVQLNDGTTKHLVTELGAYHVLCLQHVKMKLLAKSCAGCPGFSTLIINWFLQPAMDIESNLPDTTENQNLKLYLRGARYQIYRLEFPECFYGLQFSYLTILLAVQFEVFLLGVSCVTKEFWLNPVGYRIGDELENFTDWPFAGVILAPSIAIVQKISMLKTMNLPRERILAEEQTVRRAQRNKDACVAAYNAWVSSYVPNMDSCDKSGMQKDDSIQLPKLNQQISLPAEQSPDIQFMKDTFESYLGIKKVPDLNAAIQYIYSEPQNDLLVVCGWPRGMQVFFSAILNSIKMNIIILAPNHPSGVSSEALLPFNNMCAWVRGSALDVTDLMRAGVLQARSCCVFSTLHVPWRRDMGSLRTDTQAILVREFIYALRNSDTMTGRRLRHFIHAQAAQKSAEAAYDFPEKSSKRENTAKNCIPEVIMDICQEKQIDYIKETPLKSTVTLAAKSEQEDAWAQHGLCMSNPEFTSGRVLLEEMLHSMLCYSLPVSRFCTDSRIIDHLIGGAHLPLPPGMRSKCPLWMEPLPRGYEGSPFGLLMTDLLKSHLKLAFGIYRRADEEIKRTPLDLIQGNDAFNYLVISCPPMEMLLRSEDQIYVIHACPTEALGLLMSVAEQAD